MKIHVTFQRRRNVGRTLCWWKIEKKLVFIFCQVSQFGRIWNDIKNILESSCNHKKASLLEWIEAYIVGGKKLCGRQQHKTKGAWRWSWTFSSRKLSKWAGYVRVSGMWGRNWRTVDSTPGLRFQTRLAAMLAKRVLTNWPFLFIQRMKMTD